MNTHEKKQIETKRFDEKLTGQEGT